MTFKDLVMKKRIESREAFVALMQDRKKRISSGESKEEVEADLILKN